MSEEIKIDNTEKLRIEVEKIKAEISKINAETLNLNRPFILSPGTWGILATAIIGIGGFVIQIYHSDIEYQKTIVLKESALLDAKQAEDRTRKAKEELSSFLVSVEKNNKITEDRISEAQLKLDSGKTEEAKTILNQVQTSNQASSKQSTEAIKQLSQSSADLNKLSSKIAETLPMRVYPQVANELQKTKAAEISAKLKQNNFNVQAIDNVEGEAKIPSQTEIRFFRNEDRIEAEKLLGILKKEFNLTNSVAIYVSNQKSTTPERNLEIWFSKDAF